MSAPAEIEENKAKVRRFYERSHANDLAVYDDMLAPDFVDHGGPAGDLHGFRNVRAGVPWASSPPSPTSTPPST